MTLQNEQPKDGLTVHIKEVNRPLFASAIEDKLEALEKVKKTCIKEKQTQAAKDLQPDIDLLRVFFNHVKPQRSLTLPIK